MVYGATRVSNLSYKVCASWAQRGPYYKHPHVSDLSRTYLQGGTHFYKPDKHGKQGDIGISQEARFSPHLQPHSACSDVIGDVRAAPGAIYRHGMRSMRPGTGVSKGTPLLRVLQTRNTLLTLSRTYLQARTRLQRSTSPVISGDRPHTVRITRQGRSPPFYNR